MLQSDIFCQVYLEFVKKLENLTKEKELSNILKSIKKTDATCDVSVNDIRQVEFDRNGEQVIVDEKMYMAPTVYQMAFSVEVSGKSLEWVLKLYGMVARYLKDNPSLELGEYGWHLCNMKEVFLEPCIRGADSGRVSKNSEGIYSYRLQYLVLVSLNSMNASEFTRARERVVSSDVK